MEAAPLGIEGAFVFTPTVHSDERGAFLESFRDDVLREVTGRPLEVAQTNTSVSAVGTIRGIHFADVPPSQAKYVSCASGAVLDVIVDIRTGSPAFGRWEAVLLDDRDRRAVFVSEGLGHGFMALTPGATVSYLCSTRYAPGREHGINPLDAALAIQWPTAGIDGAPISPLLSPKDAAAPSLAEAESAGLLPRYDDVRSWLTGLARR